MASEERKKFDMAIGRYIETAMRKLQLRTFQALVSATPVDTGFARGGWSPSVGEPEPGPTDPPEKRELAEQQAAQLFAAHTKAAEALASGYKLNQGVVFLVNHVRYIGILNGGSSAQAPANFVEQAIRTAISATKRDLAGAA